MASTLAAQSLGTVTHRGSPRRRTAWVWGSPPVLVQPALAWLGVTGCRLPASRTSALDLRDTGDTTPILRERRQDRGTDNPEREQEAHTDGDGVADYPPHDVRSIHEGRQPAVFGREFMRDTLLAMSLCHRGSRA